MSAFRSEKLASRGSKDRSAIRLAGVGRRFGERYVREQRDETEPRQDSHDRESGEYHPRPAGERDAERVSDLTHALEPRWSGGSVQRESAGERRRHDNEEIVEGGGERHTDHDSDPGDQRGRTVSGGDSPVLLS
ncbi:MAG: hypothetical protein ACI8TL_000204 [Natronomonas sp.]|jgi:hypothetical protein